MLGQPATTLTVDLDQFRAGGDRPWTQTVHGLLDRYGPFVLAYMEALVRISDWRASGGRELPTARDHPKLASAAPSRCRRALLGSWFAGQFPAGVEPGRHQASSAA